MIALLGASVNSIESAAGEIGAWIDKVATFCLVIIVLVLVLFILWLLTQLSQGRGRG
jgi:flagellar biogenesis protein FliO